MNNRLLRPLMDAVRQVYLFLFTRGQDQVVTQSGDLLRAEQTTQSDIYGAGLPVTITELPSGTASADMVLAVDNAAATITQKITLGSIPGLAPPQAHTHDDRYYTETEVNSFLAGKSDTTHTHSAATTTVAGFLSAADKTKLDGIASNATANSTDAQLRDRATHTGTQAATTITGLATVATSGSYTDLSNRPATFPPSAHTHTLAEVTDAGTAASRNTPATGDATSTQVVLGSDTRLTNSRSPTAHTHPTGDITGLGTIATQNANSVAITGGSINGTTIGATTASTGAFTTVTTTGNVGIGTTAPGAKLDVNGNINFGLAGLKKYAIATDNNGVYFFDGANSRYPFKIDAGAYDNGIVINSTGNVGIGRSDPSYKLDVYGGAVGNTAGNAVWISRVQADAANSLFLETTLQRISSGSGWTTTAFRVQARVDATKFGYIDYLNGISASMAFGRGTTEFARIDSTGNVGIGTTDPTISSGVGLHIGGSTMRLDTARTPASSTATGNTGEICWDSSYLYVCVATNSWRRIALSTF